MIDYVQDQLLPYFWHWRGFLEGRMQLCRTPTILRVLEREFHSVMKPSNKCAYTSSPSERILCLQPKIFENKCAIACIEETVYWTELANQAQNTIHYMV